MSDTPLQKVISRLHGVKKLGNGGYQAHCPAHADEHASLTVSEDGAGGKILLHCHAQECSYEDVMTAIGLTKKDGFPESDRDREAESHKSRSRSAPKPAPTIVATYDYRDADGSLAYQVVRMTPKDFRQRRPDPDKPGSWLWDLKSTDRILYRLPELVQAVAASRTIAIVEGEKDADNLAAIGITATTNSGGAGKWKHEYSAHLRSARVVIIPDNDAPGKKHAREVALSLSTIAGSIKILELPGLTQKGDVSDWLLSGGTREKLGELVKACREWDPAAEAETQPAAGDMSINLRPVPDDDDDDARADTLILAADPRRRFTDAGLGELLVKTHGDAIRYCHAWNTWLVWDSALWIKDATGQISRFAKSAALQLYAMAAETDDYDERELILKHAKRALSANGKHAMLDWASSELGVPISPDDLDQDPWLLNCMNGTVNLRTGALRPHAREDLMTKMCTAEYNPEYLANPAAHAPVFLAFLDRVMGGDQELISFLQRVAGYSLTGDTGEHCLFFLHGSGRNGKSTFINALQYVMGDYATTVRPESFLEQRGAPSGSNDIAALQGARLVATVEISEGRRLAEGLIKQLVGGDRISARFLYGEFFEFTPQFKIFMAANAKPIIRGTDIAIWERINLIPFEAYIPPEERDKNLGIKLQAEADGILAWAVQGCIDWHRSGLNPPAKVRAATAEYRSEMDVLAAFIDECCITEDPNALPGTGMKPRVRSGDFYHAYQKWCDDNAEKPIGKNSVGRRLSERGYSLHKGTGGARLWLGIGLKVEEGHGHE